MNSPVPRPDPKKRSKPEPKKSLAAKVGRGGMPVPSAQGCTAGAAPMPRCTASLHTAELQAALDAASPRHTLQRTRTLPPFRPLSTPRPCLCPYMQAMANNKATAEVYDFDAEDDELAASPVPKPKAKVWQRLGTGHSLSTQRPARQGQAAADQHLHAKPGMQRALVLALTTERSAPPAAPRCAGPAHAAQPLQQELGQAGSGQGSSAASSQQAGQGCGAGSGGSQAGGQGQGQGTGGGLRGEPAWWTLLQDRLANLPSAAWRRVCLCIDASIDMPLPAPPPLWPCPPHPHPFPPPHTSPLCLQDDEEDEVVDMTISPAPARAAAPRRTAAAAKPKYVESESEAGGSSGSESEDGSDDYCPSDD